MTLTFAVRSFPTCTCRTVEYDTSPSFNFYSAMVRTQYLVQPLNISTFLLRICGQKSACRKFFRLDLNALLAYSNYSNPFIGNSYFVASSENSVFDQLPFFFKLLG